MKECWECGATGMPLHNHHPVPRSRGGTRTIPLCEPCHSKAHHKKKNMCSSVLTKEGLKKAKARGVKLGNRTNLKTAQRNGVRSVIRNADEYAQRIWPIVLGLRQSGIVSNNAIAKRLNEMQVCTRRGGKWYDSSVKNLIVRMDRIEQD